MRNEWIYFSLFTFNYSLLILFLLVRKVLRVDDRPKPILDQAFLAEVLGHGELIDAVLHSKHTHHLHLDFTIPGVTDQSATQSPAVGLTPTTTLWIHHQMLTLRPEAVKLVVKVAPERRQLLSFHTQKDKPASIEKGAEGRGEIYSAAKKIAM